MPKKFKLHVKTAKGDYITCTIKTKSEEEASKIHLRDYPKDEIFEIEEIFC